MSLPHYRGPSSKDIDMHRTGGDGKGRVDEVNQSLLEQQNDQRWEELGAQVNLLKSLSIDINSEVNDQNSLLDGMGSSIGNTGELLGNTIGRIGNMISSGGSSHMMYLVAFVVFFFLVLWMFMK